MKSAFIILFTFTLLSFSCTKNNSTTKTTNYQSTGVITGQDLTMCACCGGYLITINNQKYEFYNFPAGCTIDSSHFPISVELNWHSTTTCSSVSHIIIDGIQKVN